jgi:Na+/H+ antiporter
MSSAQILVALLGTVTVLAGAARRLAVPSPIVLVAGGVLISLVPGLPSARLDPDIIFFVFLPPLVYAAGFNSSPSELRAQAKRIGILAVGLVCATTAAVGVVVHAVVPGFGWPEAFVLGAILAPTDPVAAVAILQRLRVPPAISALIEGESLVNDGIGLVLYRLAVATTVTGTFSLAEGAAKFVLVSAGGVAVGLLVAAVLGRLRGRIDDAPIEITLSLFTPYLAYIAAEAIGASGILAAVVVGLQLGRRTSGLFSASVRVEAFAFWNALVFLLESALFLLMGLQFRTVAGRIEGLAPDRVVLAVVVTALVVILLRLAWMFTGSPLLRRIIPGRPEHEPAPTGAGGRLITGWAGMRGAVSLAAALAIPATVDGGGPFPQRNLIIFVVFCLILLGLLVQGTTLPLLVRATGLGGADDDRVEAEAHGRAVAAEAALARLEELGDETDPDALRRMRELYEARLRHAQAPLDESGDEHRAHVESFVGIREELLRAEREAVHALHERGELSQEAVRAIERDLDLQEARLD